MTKQLLSLFLALAMVFSLGVPAFASEQTEESAEVALQLAEEYQEEYAVFAPEAEPELNYEETLAEINQVEEEAETNNEPDYEEPAYEAEDTSEESFEVEEAFYAEPAFDDEAFPYQVPEEEYTSPEETVYTEENSSDAEGEVRVIFDVVPSWAELHVYREVDGYEVEVYPEEDRSFRLVPGDYTYTAFADGYETAEKTGFVLYGDVIILNSVYEDVRNPIEVILVESQQEEEALENVFAAFTPQQGEVVQSVEEAFFETTPIEEFVEQTVPETEKETVPEPVMATSDEQEESEPEEPASSEQEESEIPDVSDPASEDDAEGTNIEESAEAEISEESDSKEEQAGSPEEEPLTEKTEEEAAAEETEEEQSSGGFLKWLFTGKSPEKTEKEPEEEKDTKLPEAANQEAEDSEDVSEELDVEDSSDEKPTVDDAEEISIRSAGNTKSGTSGKCGPNLNYTIDSDGVLTISGTGEMYGTGTGLWPTYDPPWYGSTIRNSIRKIVIEEGVTSIGAFAFMDCTSVKEVAPIPSTINTIDYRAFYYCGYDTLELHFTGSKPSFGDDVFLETTVKCYYNKNDSSWTGMGNYGADSIEWIGEEGATANEKPEFSVEPEDVTVNDFSDYFTLTYKLKKAYADTTITWEYSYAGSSTWHPTHGSNDSEVAGHYSNFASHDGTKYRVKAENSYGTTYSRAATVTVKNASITSVSITITPPAVGEKPDYNPGLPSDAHVYCKNDVMWFDKTVEQWLNMTDSFIAGHEYTFRVDLTPASGYFFANDFTATVNGKTATTELRDGGEDSDDYMRLTYTFPALSASGWKQNSKGWWYQRADGTYPKNQWEKIDGKWYHFDASGYMQTGWLSLSGKWYYCASSGAMVTGWKQLSGKWYYFESGGAMATGWKQLGGKWYYFESGGAMATGWKQLSGKWYYFESGGAMVTGWKQLSGKWYYFESSGVMLANTSRTIGGKTYKFDANGVCTNP